MLKLGINIRNIRTLTIHVRLLRNTYIWSFVYKQVYQDYFLKVFQVKLIQKIPVYYCPIDSNCIYASIRH